MEIEILEERENPLLGRKELKFRILHDRETPKRAEVREKLIGHLKAKKEIVVLDSIHSKFGARESVGEARIYKTKERAVQVEQPYLLEKNLLVGKKEEAKSEKETPEPEKVERELKEEAPKSGQEASGAGKEKAKSVEETTAPEKKEAKPGKEAPQAGKEGE
jgi:small subunit ribosomal protein S24e